MTPRRAPEVEELLPGAVAYEMWGDGDPAWLHEAEAHLVENAVAARVCQFAAGRRCAHLALGAFGVEPAPMLRAAGRSPAWPGGFYGSISHTEGYAVAVVGRPGPSLSSAGIDAERVGRIGEKLYSRIFVAAERRWLAGIDGDRHGAAATTMFGLKESFYKAQFPLTAAWVGFQDVAVADHGGQWVLDRATELAALHAVELPCTGRSLVRDGIVVSAVGVRSAGARPDL